MTRATPLELLLKYNPQVPRYTSYPPAPYFVQDPEALDAIGLIEESNHAGAWNVSYYFHIPFCPKRCHFCGCHTETGRSGSFIREYMETLFKEAELLVPRIDASRPVTQVHFGGGTPNAVPYARLKALLDILRAHAPLEPDAEVAIECDPNLVTVEKIEELRAIGFNRLSIGIQDFNPKVLEAVNRRFPKTAPKELFRACRDLGFSGNNLDLIYGLPYQTPESFRETVDKAIDAGPDRISLFPYAHMPWIKGHQGALEGLPMPDPARRLEIALGARSALEQAGYQAIGMDHFARRSDELAVAAREGSLHRNFQGYCTAGRVGQVYAMGASAITQLHRGYLQNTKDLEEYRSQVLAGKLPWSGAYRMRPEDQAVRSIITGLLCAGRVDLQSILAEADVSPGWITCYLKECLRKLSPFLEDGLVAIEDGVARLVGNGHYVARSVAAAFDPMQAGNGETDTWAPRPRYSKAI